MTWIWAVISVICALLTLFGAVIVHLRTYDWEQRLEKVENRTLSNRTKLYNELGKTRDEVLHEVQAFLHERDENSSSANSDIGQAILMQMLAGGLGMGPAAQPDEEGDRFDAIDNILLGHGGDNESS